MPLTAMREESVSCLFGREPTEVRRAREATRKALYDWGLGEHSEFSELIVSELVTNGVQASQELFSSRFNGQWIPGQPPVRLWLQANHARVLIQVWDGSDRMPHGGKPEPDMERGRGLLIVEALCERYGSYTFEGCSGKVVWGEVMQQRANT